MSLHNRQHLQTIHLPNNGVHDVVPCKTNFGSNIPHMCWFCRPLAPCHSVVGHYMTSIPSSYLQVVGVQGSRIGNVFLRCALYQNVT